VSTCAATLAAARPPTRGCKITKNEPIATGKKANTPEKYEPIEWLAAVTMTTQSVTTPARQARSRAVNCTRLIAPSARNRLPAYIASG
jgi:hypothetical protein